MTAQISQRERANDPIEAIRTALDGFRANLWTAMPAIVTKVDRAKNTVNAQVAVRDFQYDKLGPLPPIEIPELLDLPLVFPRGGGLVLTFPIAVGDECLVVFANRCIDGWWQLGGVQNPIEYRPNELSDGFALVGVFSAPNVPSGISSNSAQLRTASGTTFVEVTAGGAVNIHSTGPTSVQAGGNVSVTAGGSASLSASGPVTISGSVVSLNP